ncbi:prolyl oligopeptidase family serine peptidase [Gramella sp. GC03-9]|uniref:prolyl oligopeptidase n=1 Tax=Christiangramia oceanisediminis TaxID=2920386 RepID=A0A9X2I9C5_9FLAO|nr:prolyl oligopeptidase family serine peptidase [Gramella oceanisediminis]MCP9199836.1 prolyl oligopeptidase family serine peptidase [Gramella oceanisediminis]
MKARLLFTVIYLIGHNVFSQQSFSPPSTEERPDTLMFAGNKVVDPYSYLEEYKDPEVANWYKAQADYAKSVLDKITGQDRILEEMAKIEKNMSASVSNLIRLDNGSYFYQQLEPDGRPERAFMKALEGRDAEMIFDPLTYKPEKGYHIRRISPSPEGTKLAIILNPNSGEEKGELIFIDLRSGKFIGDTLYNIPTQPLSWIDEENYLVTKNRGEEILNREVYHSSIRDGEKTDQLFFSAEKFPELQISPEESPHVTYYPDLGLYLANAYTTLGYYKSFLKRGDNWEALNSIDDVVSGLQVTENGIYFKSGKDSPNFRILRSSLDDPTFENAEEIVPEPEDGNITSYTSTDKGIFYVIKKNGVQSNLYFKDLASQKVRKIELPVAASNIGVIKIKGSEEIEISVSGWTTPGRRFIYNYETDSFRDLVLVKHKPLPEIENLVVEELMVPSHDDVKVPLSLLHHSKMEKNSDNIILMMVYGAYGQNNGPDYIPQIMAITNLDIICAFPHVRGGGELGEGWHKAGQKELKYNTWKDVIASAEYLISTGYTTADKIILLGASAGGIAAGMAMNERPDLFGAVINEVGAVSLMNKNELPTAKVNNPEFGDVNDPEEFEIVKAMNSFTHLKKDTEYPATLVFAGYNDVRILPYVPGKYAAKLQNYTSSEKPVLFAVDFSQGHGMATYEDFKKNFARNLSFGLWQAGHPEFQYKTE